MNFQRKMVAGSEAKTLNVTEPKPNTVTVCLRLRRGQDKKRYAIGCEIIVFKEENYLQLSVLARMATIRYLTSHFHTVSTTHEELRSIVAYRSKIPSTLRTSSNPFSISCFSFL